MIKYLFTDVDGSLTDGRVLWTDKGGHGAFFSVKDGMGIRMLQEAFVEVIFITSSRDWWITQRANHLNVTSVMTGVESKVWAVYDWLLAKHNTSYLTDEMWLQVAAFGDDLNDISMISKVGFSGCPSDAHCNVKEKADVVTLAKGGYGAFREFAEIVLELNECTES